MLKESILYPGLRRWVCSFSLSWLFAVDCIENILSMVCQGCASHAYRHVYDLRTVKGAHVAFIPTTSIILGFKVAFLHPTFRIQINAYLFNSCDIEGGLTVLIGDE